MHWGYYPSLKLRISSKFYTYILYNSATHRYYVGFTPDLKNRIKEHLLGYFKSTKSDLHYELVWYCAFKERELALQFERYLKSGSGVAFMKKRFFKSRLVALAKDTISNFDEPATRSPKGEV